MTRCVALLRSQCGMIAVIQSGRRRRNCWKEFVSGSVIIARFFTCAGVPGTSFQVDAFVEDCKIFVAKGVPTQLRRSCPATSEAEIAGSGSTRKSKVSLELVREEVAGNAIPLVEYVNPTTYALLVASTAMP